MWNSVRGALVSSDSVLSFSKPFPHDLSLLSLFHLNLSIYEASPVFFLLWQSSETKGRDTQTCNFTHDWQNQLQTTDPHVWLGPGQKALLLTLIINRDVHILLLLGKPNICVQQCKEECLFSPWAFPCISQIIKGLNRFYDPAITEDYMAEKTCRTFTAETCVLFIL